MSLARKRLKETENMKETFVSRPSRKHSQIEFVNRSERIASVFWVDFNGKKVSYKVLDPGSKQLITTFVGHVWVFEDFETGEGLITTQGEYVYLTPTNPNDKPLIVEIVIPVFSLTSMCMRLLRRHFTTNEIDNFFMPHLLKNELLHYYDKEPYTEYNHHQ